MPEIKALADFIELGGTVVMALAFLGAMLWVFRRIENGIENVSKRFDKQEERHREERKELYDQLKDQTEKSNAIAEGANNIINQLTNLIRDTNNK